jgi:hypothetical protein
MVEPPPVCTVLIDAAEDDDYHARQPYPLVALAKPRVYLGELRRVPDEDESSWPIVVAARGEVGVAREVPDQVIGYLDGFQRPVYLRVFMASTTFTALQSPVV